MAKAVDYASHQYAHLPKLIADKQTIRFQNGVTQLHTDSATTSNFASGDPSSSNVVNQYLLLLGAHTTTVQSENGIEVPPPVVKQKDPASQNGQVSQGGAGLVLGIILVDAAKGEMSWLRWQTIDGKKTAVFAFSVNKKQSHYKINYCCFPVMENIGSSGSVGKSAMMPTIASQPGGISTSFKSFTAAPGYRGSGWRDRDQGRTPAS